MTFIEAALKVLEHEGRPLHSRDIAERAVEWGLLSHVGKTPVQTMSGCLSAAVAKGPGKTAFARVSPGVFGLAAWNGKPPGRQAGDPPRVAPKKAAVSAAALAALPVTTEKKAAEAPAKAAPAAEDTPVEPAAKRRKRKRRRKRTDEPDGGGRQKETEGTEGTEGTHLRQPGSEKREPEAANKPRPEKREPAAQKPRPEKRAPEAAEKPPLEHQEQLAPSKPVSKTGDLADRAEEALRATTKPIPLPRLCEALGTPGGAAAALLDALLTADGIEREQRGIRPRFIEHRGGWALAEREVSAEIIALERQATEASERLSRLAERQVLRRLRALPQDVLARVVVVFLRRFGFGQMRAVDRGRGEELHLSVQDRRRGGRFCTAVVVRRDPVDHPVTDADVAALRGALHHYEAMSALIITTGVVDDRARAEAKVPNLAPVALVDGETLASELVQHEIGVRQRRVSLPAFDESFFATLAE